MVDLGAVDNDAPLLVGSKQAGAGQLSQMR